MSMHSALVAATKMVLGAALIVALVAIASSTRSARFAQAGPNCDADTTIDSQEAALVALINIHRAGNGLDTLVFSDTLNQAAAWKSQHMAANDYTAHHDEGINRDWFERLRDCGYTAGASLSENIAWGFVTAADAFAFWWASPVHNRIMLGPDLVAIGVAHAFDAKSEFGWYWTTDFGGVNEGFSADTPAPPVPPVPPPEGLPGKTGDTNCDGLVNPLDAALVLQLAAGMIPALACPGAGDTNGDGITNPLDAALVLQFSAGLLGSLPP